MGFFWRDGVVAGSLSAAYRTVVVWLPTTMECAVVIRRKVLALYC